MPSSLFLSLVVAISGTLAQQQGGGGQQVPLAPNRNELVGTWVSNSQGVVTGPGFVNPLNFSFHYPKVTGVSYSFSEDLHFEEAFYKFTVNASQPNCITGVLQWQHGTYQPLQNGSIILNPISSDGRQQVQDTCSPVSNIIQQFNATTLLSTWEIRTDVALGKELWLYAFDGRPEQPLYPFADPPIMLPKETLTGNVTIGQTQAGSASSILAPIIYKTLVTALIGGSLFLSWL